MILKIFCKHEYKEIAKRKSNYTSDYQYFSDLGWYNDILLECKKCRKRKIKTVPNETHPMFQKWEKVGD